MNIASWIRRNGILLRQYVTLCGLVACWTYGTAADCRGDEFEVTAPPADMKLPEFYKKYVSAGGYPVVSSEKVSDYALKEAAYLVNLLLAQRPDVRRAMVRSGSRLIVMAHNEFTTDIPEYAQMKPKDYWDARARGLGGSRTDPVCSCAEENVLCYAGDPYHTESIVIHEFAHNIHLRGLVNTDPTFDDRLKSTYKSAMAKGLWKTKYASVNHAEYWAEGVQSWFGNNRPPDHDHNHVDTRKELQEYDPGLAALCQEVFGNTRLEYTKPTTRLHGHLKGYDPQQAPRFRWPERLDAVRKDIRNKARNRGKPKPKQQPKPDSSSARRRPSSAESVVGWTQFRGPLGTGVARDDKPLPLEIGPDQHVIWKRPIAKGHSSPVIHGNRMFLTAVQDRKLLTLALSTTTGETLWEHASEYDKLESVHRIGSPATSSVTTDGERVVSFFGSCGMNAFDLDGKLLWHRPMGPFHNQFGATSSPILADDRIINIQDHDTGSYLVAIDKRTGKDIWKTERPNFRRNYGSPVLWNVNGQRQIVIAGTAHVMGYDFASGQLIWTVRGLCRVVSNTPVIGDDGVLYVASTGGGSTPPQPAFAQLLEQADANNNGALERDELPKSSIKGFFEQFDRDQNGKLDASEYESIREIFRIARSTAVAIKPGGQGNITDSHVLWSNSRGIPRNASPLHYQGYLFLAKDGGVLSILDARSGASSKQLRLAGRGKYYSSPVIGDGRLYTIDERGTLSVLSAASPWDQLHSTQLAEPVYATPAIVAGRLYVRTVGTLYCFGS